jgi:hypothetical protein
MKQEYKRNVELKESDTYTPYITRGSSNKRQKRIMSTGDASVVFTMETRSHDRSQGLGLRTQHNLPRRGAVRGN